MKELSAKHRHMLEVESGISPEVIAERGYWTETTKAELKRLGFSPRQLAVPTLVIPIRDARGEISLYQSRPDTPRISKNGKPVKYETPYGSNMRLDFPRSTRHLLGDPTKPLVVTEGMKKADSLASRGICTVGLVGVWNYRGKNEHGGTAVLADWEDVVLNDRQVFIVFDSDVMTKREVHAALGRLAGFLRNRAAKVRFVYLPAGDGHSKMGVDDYLADGHDITDLEALSTTELRAAPEPEVEPQAETWGQFTLEDGCLAIRKSAHNDNAAYTKKLCNFDAEIITHEIIDDGAETRNIFTIRGKLAGGRELPALEVLAPSFPSLNWVTGWGHRAIVNAGQGSRDYLRQAIQERSANAEELRTFGHTGWREIEPGTMAYLTASGALTADGLDESVGVNPGAGYTEYALGMGQVDQLDQSQRGREGMRASLALLDLAPDRIMAPLIAMTYAPVLGPADFAGYLYGWSGEGKTQLAILMARHYGRNVGARHMESTDNTHNASMEVLFRMKDALVVIDDVAPQSDEYQARKQTALMTRTIRYAVNHQGRKRMSADLNNRPARPPRAFLFLTGEISLPGFSLAARLFTVELPRGAIRPLTRLTPHQQASEAGLYADAMTTFVQHLARDHAASMAKYRRRWKQEEAEGQGRASHARVSTSTAQLLAVAETLLDVAEDIGATTATETAALRTRFRNGILEAAKAQEEHLQSADPITQFIETLRGLLRSGGAHLSTTDGSPPDDYRRFGWRGRTDTLGIMHTQPQGPLIGYVHDADIWLDPTPAYNAVKRAVRDQGGSALPENTLWRRLKEVGYTISEGDSRTKYRLNLGSQRPWMIRLVGSLLSETDPTDPTPGISVPDDPNHGSVPDPEVIQSDPWLIQPDDAHGSLWISLDQSEKETDPWETPPPTQEPPPGSVGSLPGRGEALVGANGHTPLGSTSDTIAIIWTKANTNKLDTTAGRTLDNKPHTSIGNYIKQLGKNELQQHATTFLRHNPNLPDIIQRSRQ